MHLEIYLDNSATTPLCPEARSAVLEALDTFKTDTAELKSFALALAKRTK